ncbi:MAG TPA: Arc family DNA binding domain-containing protein [Pseudobacteroides sp.]|nr:Arc family DNA binding domain-containing protein [Pseudobacteroides sp.]
MAEKKTVLLRLNPKTWEELSKWAEEEFRSINGQIEYILHDAIVKRRKVKPVSLEDDKKDDET